MAEYRIEIPPAVVTAMERDLGEDARGLSDRAMVVLWMQQRVKASSLRYRKQTLGEPAALIAARAAAEDALAREVTARRTAETGATTQAETDIRGIV